MTEFKLGAIKPYQSNHPPLLLYHIPEIHYQAIIKKPTEKKQILKEDQEITVKKENYKFNYWKMKAG